MRGADHDPSGRSAIGGGPFDTNDAANAPSRQPLTPEEIDKARFVDHMAERASKAGCLASKPVLISLGLGVAVFIAILTFVAGIGDDDSPAAPVTTTTPVTAPSLTTLSPSTLATVATSAASASANSIDATSAASATSTDIESATTLNPPVTLASDVTTPEAGSAASGSEGGTVADFAGHYVLTSGLDDPTGADVNGTTSPNPMTFSMVPSASIDIDDTGRIVGGTYHAAGDIGSAHYTFDGDTADGFVDANGIGQVFFHGTTTDYSETSATYTAQIDHYFQLGIEGTTIHLCRSSMASNDSCADPTTRQVATLDRAG